MKKQYTTPEVNVVNIDSSEIICASVGFGNDNTSVMHAKEIGISFEDDFEGIDISEDAIDFMGE